MLRKIVLASSIFALTTGIALAHAAPYVGASMGVTANTSNDHFFGEHFGVSSYRGMPFNLFAGYGGVIDQNFYLAAELFGTPGTVNLNSNKNKDLKTSYGYGAAVLPGLMLSDHTMAYARLGVVRAHFSEEGKNKIGGQFGLGMQTSVTQCIDVRGEYDFVAYRSFNDTTYSGYGYKRQPRADQASIGIVYKFD